MKSLFRRPLHWVVCLACLVAAAHVRAAESAAEADLRAYLDRFSGEWTGEVQLRALDGFLLKKLPATRKYSWRGDEQLVETTITDGDAQYVVTARQSIRLGRLESVVTRPLLPDDVYVGAIEQESLQWTHSQGDRRDARDQIVNRAGVRVLEASSLEPIRGLGLSGLVKLAGEFRPVASGGSQANAGAAAQNADEAGALDGPVRALEEERAQLLKRLAEAETAANQRERDLQARLDESRKSAEGLRRDLESTRSELEQLRQRSTEAEALLSASRKEGLEAGQSATALQAELQQTRELLTTARAEAERVAREAAAGEKARADLAARLEQAEGSAATSSASAADLDEARKRISGLDAELDGSRAKVGELEKALQQMRDDLEAARTAAAAASATSSEQAALEARARNAETELAALKPQLSAITESAQAKDRAASESAATLRQAQADNETLSRSIETLKTELATARERALALDREAAIAKQELAAGREEADKWRKQTVEIQAARDSLSQRISELSARPALDPAAIERERTSAREQLAVADRARTEAEKRIQELETGRREMQTSVAGLQAQLDESRLAIDAAQKELAEARENARVGAQMRVERDEARQLLVTAQEESSRRQTDNERLSAASTELGAERDSLRERVRILEAGLAEAESKARLAATAPTVPAAPATVEEKPASGPFGTRDDFVAEVQRLERRIYQLEADRAEAATQATLLQTQLTEARRLRDDTLLRFQTVVSELNTMREEKERLARANVSLQSEVRAAQSARANSATRDSRSGGNGPTTTTDGRTADVVVAAFQVIGVTRGEQEDKVILDGRVYRNGDIVEPELGIAFQRIEENALIFVDRRGREYRRRF